MAGKFKKGLVTEVKKDLADREQQKQLKQKYNIEDERIVVEKSNMIKFLLSSFSALVKVLAVVILLLLAAIGLTSLVYPSIRNPLMAVAQELYEQLLEYVPFMN